MPSIECPYCSFSISPAPKRTRKCPNCRERIVRKRQWWTESQGVFYLTEAQAEEFAQREAAEHERREFAERLRNVGASRREIDGARRKLAAQRSGEPPTDRDVFWAITNTKISQAIEEGDWHQAQYISYNRALADYEYGGERFFHYLEEASEGQLRKYQAEGVKRAEIQSDDCAVCKPRNGKKYAITKALRTLPIPHRDCEDNWSDNPQGGFCRCMWLPVVDW